MTELFRRFRARRKRSRRTCGTPNEPAARLTEHAVHVGLCEIGILRRILRWFGFRRHRHVPTVSNRPASPHALQVIDRATDALAGEVLEGACFEDCVEPLGDRRDRCRVLARMLYAGADRFAASMIWLALARLPAPPLPVEAAGAGFERRSGDDAADLLLDAGKLAGQVRLAEVEQFARYQLRDFHRQLGDPAIHELPQPADGDAELGLHDRRTKSRVRHVSHPRRPPVPQSRIRRPGG